MRALAPGTRGRARGGHHGGTSCSSATSHSQPASGAANSASSVARRVGHGAAVEEVPGQDAASRPYPPRLAAPPPHRRRADAPTSSLALLDRAAELKAAPRSSRRAARTGSSRSSSRRPRRARGCPSRPASSSSAATRWSCAPTRCSSRAASRSSDTALVLSRHVDAVGVRTGPDALLEELAAEGTIPVFNMLTAGHHPCQALADLLTLREAFGRARGPQARLRRRRQQRRALARRARRRSPASRSSSPRRPATSSSGVADASTDPARGGRAARTPSTPTCGSRWATRRRPTRAAPRSRPTASTTRCSTAPRPTRSRCTACPPIPGEEITAEVLYGPRQRIWDQAENRRHAQKALLEWLLATTP